MKHSDRNRQPLFETIVVGVDFSKYSKIVLRQAQLLSQQLHSKLVVVYADWLEWQMPSPEVFLPIPPADLDEIEMNVQEFYHIQDTERISIKVLHGTIPEMVLEVASRYPSPLIVVGSQGKGAISRFILGSNAEAIALKSPYPVWVHRGNKIVPLKKVLVPTDLSEASHQQIETLKSWCQRLPLSLNYLFVKPEIVPTLHYPTYKATASKLETNINTMIKKFKRATFKAPLITMTSNNPSDVIRRAGENFDVIAMNPHDRGGFIERFGRVTAKVIRLAENPVLVMRGS